MEYTTLGSTGMEVSRICLGGMSFGSPEWRDWVLNEEESHEIIERAIELGINFFDTANLYSNGRSEQVLGNILSEYDRDEHVIATKVFFPPEDDPHPNATGLSRKTIEQELVNSLNRLDIDTVDLYQIHRYDNNTPINETLRTLDDAVRRNHVRYIGASSMWAHQFGDALHSSDKLGLERFQTMQNHYNLTYREEEREMIPLCDKEGVGLMPWSPLARGYLTRPHEEFMQSIRAEYMHEELSSDFIPTYQANGGAKINEHVQKIATDKGASMAQISLAWLLHQDPVDAPIVGTTSVDHLEDAVEALEIDLSRSDIDYLEEPYEPVHVSGHV